MYSSLSLFLVFRLTSSSLHLSPLPTTQGSQWNDAGRYDAGIFENCEAETGEKPGIYNNKRWHQGEKPEPEAHKPGKLLGCKRFNGFSRGKAKLIPGSRRRMDEEDFVERVEGIEWDVRDDKVHVPGDGWF